MLVFRAPRKIENFLPFAFFLFSLFKEKKIVVLNIMHTSKAIYEKYP